MIRRNLDIKPDSEEASRIISRITDFHSVHSSKFGPKREKIIKGYNYLAGVHPQEKQRKWFEVQRRPLRTFNLIFPQFNSTIGDILLNEETPRVFSHIGGSKEAAQAHSDLLDRANIRNDFRSLGAKWAISSLVEIGWIHNYWGNEHEVDGSLVYEWVDEYDMIFDTAARQDLLDDAQAVERFQWLTKEEILARWPNHKRMLEDSLTAYKDGHPWPSGITSANDFFNSDYYNEFSGRYKVIEHHERDIEQVDVAYDPDTNLSEIFYLEGKKADMYFKTHPNSKLIKRKAKAKKVYYVLPALNFLLQSEYAAIQDETYDYVNCSAYNYGRQVVDHFGIIQNAADPMDDFNEWRNLANDIMRKTVDPGFTYRDKELRNPEDVELYGSQTGVNFKVKSNSQMSLSDVIKKNDIGQLPFGPDQMSQEAVEFLNKITNITANISGQTQSSNENASLFRQRVDQARIALAIIYNNFNKAKRRFYNKGILTNQKYLTFEKWYAYQSPKKEGQFGVNVKVGEHITNNITVGTYEVFAEALDKNPSIRSLRFAQKTDAVNIMLKLFGTRLQNPTVIAYMIKWWLEDSDLGGVEELTNVIIQSLTDQFMAADADMQEEQAVQRTNDLIDTAQKMVNLNGGGAASTGLPETASANAPNQSK